ncbi:MAG: hypothetical protein ABR991_13045 [Terracidiphilus sp.]|jgi:ADP-heptose:LPS heptosyltransferase
MTEEKSNCDTCKEAIEVLGKRAETRQFLLSLFLTTSFHLASRPISFANDSFFSNMARYADEVLANLNSEGWETLGEPLEKGISILTPISQWPHGSEAQQEMAKLFAGNYRRYFRSLNLPWSTFPPLDHLTLNDWPKPMHIFLAVGPNIGIGDEMIFFQAAQRLLRRFPEAHLEISSFHASLWELSGCVHTLQHSRDSVTPYAHAKKLMGVHPDALVIFVEFASAPIYRQLERVPDMGRFIYVDTGARLIRMVDQQKPAIAEYRSLSKSVYGVIDDLLNHIGLEHSPRNPSPVNSKNRGSGKRLKVFLNPFTSKDTSEIGAEWWAKIINSAAVSVPLHAEIFSGINETTRSYAQEIQDALDTTVCTSHQFGCDAVPSIGDTLKEAMESDAIVGVDTFTGHVFNLKSTPSITVFLGSSWQYWRVPDPAVMNVWAQDDPAAVGKLLTRLLLKPEDSLAMDLLDQLRLESVKIHDQLSASDFTGALALVRNCDALGRQLGEIDPDSIEIFTDPPIECFHALIEVLSKMSSPTESLRQLLAEAWAQWESCNFNRYLHYLEEVWHA